MFYLLIGDHGLLQSEGEFKTCQELKQYLVDNTENIFGWILDQDDNTLELPDFTIASDLQDIQYILDFYDFSWWTVYADHR